MLTYKAKTRDFKKVITRLSYHTRDVATVTIAKTIVRM